MNNFKKLVSRLNEKNYKVVSVESFTGGLFAHKYTSIPQSSKSFIASLVTYSNDAKKKIIFLNDSTIKNYGVVSKETASQMIKGAMKQFPEANLVISFTGNAGPIGMENKKVGLVYIGIYLNNNLTILEKNFKGSRKTVQSKAIKEVIGYLEQNL